MGTLETGLPLSTIDLPMGYLAFGELISISLYYQTEEKYKTRNLFLPLAKVPENN